MFYYAPISKECRSTVEENPPTASAKAALRRELLAARRARSPESRRTSARALSRSASELPELADARTVAAYVSVGGEPGTRELLDALRAAGKRVLLPLLMPDDDLDWAEYEGPGSLVEAAHPGKMRLLEPAGPPLGPDAVTAAGAVLLPGLAVDRRGMRLGRGGGSYDRVLERLERAGAHPALVVLLYDEEVVARVPEEPHDHPVQAVATPSGVVRFSS